MFTLSQMTDKELEDYADQIKVAVCLALVNENVLDTDISEEWCKSHTIILRKKNFFRTITNLWEKQKEVEGYLITVVKKVS